MNTSTRTNELRRKKIGRLHIRKQRHRSALRYSKADQRLCFRYMDSTIPLLPKSKISSLQPSSVLVQSNLSRTWAETQMTGFLLTPLKFMFHCHNSNQSNMSHVMRKPAFCLMAKPPATDKAQISLLGIHPC